MSSPSPCLTRILLYLLFTVFYAVLSTPSGSQSPAREPAATLHIDTNPRHILNSFDPDKSLGSSIDVLSRAAIDHVYTPHILQEALSAGWGPLTYRNNTELRMAAWHWNPNGSWSDAAHRSGYFTGSIDLAEPIRYILAYALPHRGFSTSGDRPIEGPHLSYWKSNPYLTRKFTRESDALHPQWVVEDLQSARPISALRILWAAPYATTYQVEYWIGKDALDFDHGPDGEWKTFQRGHVDHASGGTVTLSLADTPIVTRYIRILMTESSNTCDEHGSSDVRNCVGYAIQEIHAGTLDASGAFADAVAAAAPNPASDATQAAAGATGPASQPTFTSSSIDPWHSVDDVKNDGLYQHTGFDLLFTSGLTNNLPAMIPVTLLYGTPEDAAAQIQYIEKRQYPISYIEMGEEPDGKHALPEDYAALYIQWARAIHRVDPKLKLGGPIFEGVNEDIHVWPDAQGRISWLGRFLAYLKDHGHLSDLAFVSFEHYPFEPCTITWRSLYAEPHLMKHTLDVWREDGVPRDIPLMVTESHLSPNLTSPMSTIFAALWLADNVGSFFEGGGSAFYHSPIQPEPLQPSCLGWATWSNFLSDRDFNIRGYTSPYFAARMINFEWVQHRSGIHQMFPSSLAIKDDDGNQLVTSYALHRPDGNWSLMLVNRDESSPHSIRVAFDDSATHSAATSRHSFFSGPVSVVTFGSEQYQWKEDGSNSHPDPDNFPRGSSAIANPDTVFLLPNASITVIRGRIH
jgi:F5/8 type C domain-containing protein